jgi:hypothetical protein
VRPSQSKPDRGIVRVHTRVYKQTGDLVAEFKRSVLVPRQPDGTRPRPRRTSTSRVSQSGSATASSGVEVVPGTPPVHGETVPARGRRQLLTRSGPL